MNYTHEKTPMFYISKNGGRRKIYDDRYVYLKDEESFDIEIINPTKDVLLAKVFFNNKMISNSGLVIRPGERFVLERYIDEDKRFIFKTYDIIKDNKNLNAIIDNGKVRVEFYKESPVFKFPNFTPNRSFPPYQPNPYNNYTIPDYPIPTIYCSNSNNFSYTSNTIETGRIEKGEDSNQNFSSVDINFEDLFSYNYELFIMPEDLKKINKEDLKSKSVFCHKCGTKSKKNHNYCSNCGTKLIK